LRFRASDFRMEILIAFDSRVKSAAVAQRIRLLSISRLASSIVLSDLAGSYTATNLSQRPNFKDDHVWRRMPKSADLRQVCPIRKAEPDTTLHEICVSCGARVPFSISAGAMVHPPGRTDSNLTSHDRIRQSEATISASKEALAAGRAMFAKKKRK